MFDFIKKYLRRNGEPSERPSSLATPSAFKQSLLSLEQRLMFDAAAAATAAEVQSEQVAQDQAEAAVSSEGTAESTTPRDWFLQSRRILDRSGLRRPHGSGL